MENSNTYDLILVGGGLANGLIALAVSQHQPQSHIALLEAGETLGADRTWSFHDTDVSASELALLLPMIRTSWASQTVNFPGLERSFSTAYHTICSEKFDHHIRAQSNVTVLLGTRARDLSADAVTCDDGRRLSAPCVIDGRGWRRSFEPNFALAYQKFVGLEIDTATPHGITEPVIMDARVEQIDGYRFLYLLPFSPTTMLVEDTYYSDHSDLDTATIESRIESYIAHRGWRVETVDRREKGVIPIVLAGDPACLLSSDTDVPASGVRAGLFHSLTGYSLPNAARLAGSIAQLPMLTSEAVATLVEAQVRSLWSAQGFYRMLNRLLFVAAKGEERRKVMQHFYRLKQPLIERFYAGQSTSADKMRILCGCPPIPIHRALGVLPASAGWRFQEQRQKTP